MKTSQDKETTKDNTEIKEAIITKGIRITSKTERSKHVSKNAMHKTFPCSVASFFNTLPDDIKIHLGTDLFKRKVGFFVRNKCWHHIKLTASSCSKCERSYAIDEQKMKNHMLRYEEILKEVEDDNILDIEVLKTSDRAILWDILCLEHEAMENWIRDNGDLDEMLRQKDNMITDFIGDNLY